MSDEFEKSASECIADLQAEQLVHAWTLQLILADLALSTKDYDAYLKNFHARLSIPVDGIDLSLPAVAGSARIYADKIITQARKHAKARSEAR